MSITEKYPENCPWDNQSKNNKFVDLPKESYFVKFSFSAASL